jgi:hypothetical protein
MSFPNSKIHPTHCLHLKHFDYRLRCKSERLAAEFCKVTVSTSEFAKFSTTKNELTFNEKKNTFHQMHLMKSQFDQPSTFASNYKIKLNYKK